MTARPSKGGYWPLGAVIINVMDLIMTSIALSGSPWSSGTKLTGQPWSGGKKMGARSCALAGAF